MVIVRILYAVRLSYVVSKRERNKKASRKGGREGERYNEGGRGKEGEGRKVRETTFKGRLLLCAGCGVRWEKLQYGKKERVGR